MECGLLGLECPQNLKMWKNRLFVPCVFVCIQAWSNVLIIEPSTSALTVSLNTQTFLSCSLSDWKWVSHPPSLLFLCLFSVCVWPFVCLSSTDTDGFLIGGGIDHLKTELIASTLKKPKSKATVVALGVGRSAHISGFNLINTVLLVYADVRLL